MKQCTKCKKWKTEKEFSKHKCKKDGLSSECKKCGEIYRQLHKEELKAKHKAYYQAHKEERKAYALIYNQTHKKEILARGKIYRQTHKERIKAYFQAHKEKKKTYDKIRYQINFKKFKKEWRNLKPSGEFLIHNRMRVYFSKFSLNIPRARWIMMKHLGRWLETWEDVHHKSLNTLDDRTENLEVHPHLGDSHVRKRLTQLTNENKKLKEEIKILKNT